MTWAWRGGGKREGEEAPIDSLMSLGGDVPSSAWPVGFDNHGVRWSRMHLLGRREACQEFRPPAEPHREFPRFAAFIAPAGQ